MNKDAFICHASEDKSSVVRPLVFALEQEGISCWLDEAEIVWGDSITQKVNEGLKLSKYVVVILSRAFLAKNWPKKELWAILNTEVRTGDVKVLPVLVGSDADIQYFLDEFPLLNDKLFLVWDGAPQLIVHNFLRLLEIAGEPIGSRQDLLICGQCRTPFERGVHVCLGCKGNVVYGLTISERLEKLKLAMMCAAAFHVILFILLPSALNSNLSLEIPYFWGLNVIPCIAIAAVSSFIAGFLYVRHSIEVNAHLVRTYR